MDRNTEPKQAMPAVDTDAAKLHDAAEREAIMSGRSFSQAYIPGMWTAINW